MLTVEPLRRERDAVAKLIADYYGLQPMPAQIMSSPTLTLAVPLARDDE